MHKYITSPVSIVWLYGTTHFYNYIVIENNSTLNVKIIEKFSGRNVSQVKEIGNWAILFESLLHENKVAPKFTSSWCLPSLKYRGTFFPKKLFMGEQTFWGQIYERLFFIVELMIIRSCQGWRAEFHKSIFQLSEHCKSQIFLQSSSDI